jgi:hypothetical protein
MKKTNVKNASRRMLTLNKETLRDLVLGGGVKAAAGVNDSNQVSICETLCTNRIDGCPVTA